MLLNITYLANQYDLKVHLVGAVGLLVISPDVPQQSWTMEW